MIENLASLKEKWEKHSVWFWPTSCFSAPTQKNYETVMIIEHLCLRGVRRGVRILKIVWHTERFRENRPFKHNSFCIWARKIGWTSRRIDEWLWGEKWLWHATLENNLVKLDAINNLRLYLGIRQRRCRGQFAARTFALTWVAASGPNWTKPKCQM